MLRIDGLVEKPLELDFHGIEALSEPGTLVEHTERLSPKVRGSGIRLGAVLALARPLAHATHVMVHDAGGDYRACLALDDEATQAVLAHALNGQPLPDELGGPLRLLVPTSDNACLSVKRVTRLQLLDHAEPDTVPRPTTPLRRP